MAVLQKVIENDTYQPSGAHEGFNTSWLDNAFPYIDSEQPAGSTYTTHDVPSASLQAGDTSFSINRNYRTSTMYRPTSGVYVPLLTRGWSWIMSGHKDANGNWTWTGGVAIQGGSGNPFDLDDATFQMVYKNKKSYPYPGH